MRFKKNIIKFFSIPLAILISLGSTQVYAEANKKIQPNEQLQFTVETKEKNEFIHLFVNEGVVLIQDGRYVINSGKISNISEDQLLNIEKDIAFFNEGLGLGLFELDTNNYIISSTNYQSMETFQITPCATVVYIESTLIANSDTMSRVNYINWQTYGTTVGTVQTGLYFATKVKSGGAWDYKLIYGPTTRRLVELDGSQEYLTGEDIGNLNYGYAGRTVFSATLLRSAAGAYQIYSGTSQGNWYKTYFDDPNDQYWINRGITYRETNAFY